MAREDTESRQMEALRWQLQGRGGDDAEAEKEEEDVEGSLVVRRGQ